MLMGVWGAGVHQAHGGPSDAEMMLTWSAPQSCPSANAFRGQVAEILGPGARRRAAGAATSVAISALGEKQWQAKVTVVGA